MAEFIAGNKKPARESMGDGNGFDAMGKEVPIHRKTAALEHAKQMGVDSADAWECVGAMAEQVKRDQPYEAMRVGMRFMACIAAGLPQAIPVELRRRAFMNPQAQAVNRTPNLNESNSEVSR